MIVILLCIVVIVVAFHFVRRSQATERKSDIRFTPQGVAVGDAGSVAWGDIRKIDVCRMPASGGSDFFVVLFGNNAVTVHATYRQFDRFAALMFERWPAIRDEWMRIFNGSPDISERVTVWHQD